MMLVDSSAWIEFIRGTGSPAGVGVRSALRTGVAITEPVMMEVLAGVRSDVDAARIRALLGRATLLACAYEDYVHAAELYRATSRIGMRVRDVTDCLIAAVAIRTSTPILHADRDFDAIARVSDLQLVTP